MILKTLKMHPNLINVLLGKNIFTKMIYEFGMVSDFIVNIIIQYMDVENVKKEVNRELFYLQKERKNGYYYFLVIIIII